MNLDAEEFWSIARLGHLLFEQGEYDEARAVFEGLTAIRSQEPYPWEALGWIASAEQEPQRAVEFLRHAVKLGAGPETSVRLAEELMKLREIAEASQILQRAAQSDTAIGLRARAILRRCRQLPVK